MNARNISFQYKLKDSPIKEKLVEEMSIEECGFTKKITIIIKVPSLNLDMAPAQFHSLFQCYT